MMPHFFLTELSYLLARFSNLGISNDLSHLSLDELWGVYRHLKRRTEARHEPS